MILGVHAYALFFQIGLPMSGEELPSDSQPTTQSHVVSLISRGFFMSSDNQTVPHLHTQKEVEEAVKEYKSSDLSGTELISLWQAIHDASLDLAGTAAVETEDEVPGDDSY